MPLGHRAHAAHARLADRGHRAQAVAVERVERNVETCIAGRAHQKRQVVAPVAGDHGVGARRLNLGGVRRKVANPAQRMKLVADDLHARAALRQQVACRARHLAPEAVILVDQVDALRARIGRQHLHQRRHPHLRVRVEAEMPWAATLVGQHRINRRVIEEHLPFAGIALVVAVDRIDQRAGHRRAISLQDEAHALVGRAPQEHQRLLDLTLGVVACQLQRTRALRKLHAAARVDAVDRKLEIARHRLAGIGKRPRQAFDHAEPDLLGSRRARCADKYDEDHRRYPPSARSPCLLAQNLHCKSR